MKSILAVSSSRVGNSGYLQSVAPLIKNFLGDTSLKIGFIPFATADNDYEAYGIKVGEGLQELSHTIEVVNEDNAKELLERADAIMVGGGNTFKLLHDIYKNDLIELIRIKVNNGTPYIGWSAGANITGLTISTTNDMPIIQPASFEALAFLPFQINPHYLNVKPEGHNGETRDDRLKEFLQVNPGVSIVGLPEGTALQLKDGVLTFIGDSDGVLFSRQAPSSAVEKKTIAVGEDLSYLLTAGR